MDHIRGTVGPAGGGLGWWGCPCHKPAIRKLQTYTLHTHLSSQIPKTRQTTPVPCQYSKARQCIDTIWLNLTILLPHHGGKQDTKYVPGYPAEGRDL